MAHLLHFAVGFALLFHVLFWGAGVAALAMPRPWRHFWPVLAFPLGVALQSATVWAGASVGYEGTNAYARASECVPIAFALTAVWRLGWRACWTDISRFGLVWLMMGSLLLLLIVPLAIASRGLTTISLGSCDAADYAAGARVLQEFANWDRSGFLGLTEVVSVQSVDNFFDYWIRLNHFTPSALIAFNGSVLDCAPHELVSLFSMVLLAGSLPVVFLVARAVLGYSGTASLGVTLLYGVNPITWYAVAHVAPGQAIAAQAIACITWAGVALWRGRLTWRRAWAFAGVLLAGYWLVLGSYNFILVLCLVPSATFALGWALWRGEWGRFGRWAVMMLAPLLACGGIFFERVAGLAERFALLREFDFGWRIPALSPEGWFGMVMGPDLAAWDFFGLRWVLGLLAGVALGWSLRRAVLQRVPGAWMVGAFTVPILAGYAYLEWRGVRLGTNASYDAYKLFAVFYPVLLPALCWWVTLRRSRRITEWLGVVSFGGLVLAFNLAGVGLFAWHMARPPLIVDSELRALRRIETQSDVRSVNLLIPDMWSRLWAHGFLLRKPHYFPTHTYEGRLNTRLRGEWDLQGGFFGRRAAGESARELSPRYQLVRADQPPRVELAIGPGWNDEELAPGTGDRWRWTHAEGATVVVENLTTAPLTVSLILNARSVTPRELGAAMDGKVLARTAISPVRGNITLGPLTIPPGKTPVALVLDAARVQLAEDPRSLGICVWRIEVEVQPR